MMSKMESGFSTLTTEPAADDFTNKVSNKGASNARLNVLKKIAKIVATAYGMANFSIGLANESNLKYVFINDK